MLPLYNSWLLLHAGSHIGEQPSAAPADHLSFRVVRIREIVRRCNTCAYVFLCSIVLLVQYVPLQFFIVLHCVGWWTTPHNVSCHRPLQTLTSANYGS